MPTATRPLVSVGLPVFDGESYLDTALDSLLSQTYSDFEVVISDNASTDQTQEICRRYAEQDQRVRYVRQPSNRGAVWNFNEVFRLSRGALFRWAAHDDVCGPTFLEEIVALMDREEDCSVGFCKTALIDRDGQLLPHPEDHFNEAELDQTEPCRRFLELLLHRVWLHETYGLIRREHLENTRLLPRYVGGEKILFGELALQGKFLHVPETLFFCRWHSDQASWIESAEAEQHWRDPHGRRQLIPRQARCALGQLAAVARSRLPLGQRIKCALAVARWGLQVKKWKGLASDFVHGLGSSGGRVGTAAKAGE